MFTDRYLVHTRKMIKKAKNEKKIKGRIKGDKTYERIGERLSVYRKLISTRTTQNQSQQKSDTSTLPRLQT